PREPGDLSLGDPGGRGTTAWHRASFGSARGRCGRCPRSPEPGQCARVKFVLRKTARGGPFAAWATTGGQEPRNSAENEGWCGPPSNHHADNNLASPGRPTVDHHGHAALLMAGV